MNMKRLLYILAFIVCTLSVNAQTQVVSTVYYANERISTHATTGEKIDSETRTVEFIVVGRSQVIMHTSTSLEAYYLEEGNKQVVGNATKYQAATSRGIEGTVFMENKRHNNTLCFTIRFEGFKKDVIDEFYCPIGGGANGL